MTDFNKHISKVPIEKKKMYFQLPQDFQQFVDKKDKLDTSLEKTKKRLEEQLETRKTYVSILKDKEDALKNYIEEPNKENKEVLDVCTALIDLHNIEIEIIAQKNVFVDSYIYYKEDFLKRYEKGDKEQEAMFSKRQETK